MEEDRMGWSAAGWRLACGALALMSIGCAGIWTADAPDPLALHHSAIVVDGHSDTTPLFEDPGWHFDERHEHGHMDLPRIREGGLDVEFWSIYMGERKGDGLAIREALDRIDAVYEMADRYPEDVVVTGSVAEIRAAVAQGKLASVMGVEGGHIIEDDLAALRSFYRLGVRYMTLTHSFHTEWADSSGTRSDVAPRHHGLAPFGEQVVREMNRLGMMVDISHVSDETFWDVIGISQAPVIASHSSVRAVADHRRNLDDDMLRALAKNGGVLMVNFYPAYIDEEASRQTRDYYARWKHVYEEIGEKYADDPRARREAYWAQSAAHPAPRTSLAVLLDHFDHAVQVAGPDHVGLGADWDGVGSMPEQLDDVSQLPNLTRGLLERGHSPDTVRKILGENLLRVMQDVEQVALELRLSDADGN
jgi:membrane dipeptidase